MPEYLVQGIVAFWATCLPMLTNKELSEILYLFLLIVRHSFLSPSSLLNTPQEKESICVSSNQSARRNSIGILNGGGGIGPLYIVIMFISGT